MGHAIRAESVQQGLLPRMVDAHMSRVEDPRISTGAATQIAHLAWADPFPSRPASRTVWRTMFETDRLPPGWSQRAAVVDEVWVPSVWNVNTFAAAGVERDRLRVLHSPLDTAGWESPLATRVRSSDDVVLLSVLTWALRKGWDVLLTAYFEEFAYTDPVVLVLRTDPFLFGGSNESVIEQYRRFAQNSRVRSRPRVRIIDKPLSVNELQALYHSADAFVLPSRGEGWGRPLMEAKAAGLPVVTTGWGGQMEFVDPEFDYLIDFEIMPVNTACAHEYPLFAGHQWAEPSVPHLKDILRRLVVERDKVDPIHRAAHARDIRAKFDYTRIGERATKLLAASEQE